MTNWNSTAHFICANDLYYFGRVVFSCYKHYKNISFTVLHIHKYIIREIKIPRHQREKDNVKPQFLYRKTSFHGTKVASTSYFIS